MGSHLAPPAFVAHICVVNPTDAFEKRLLLMGRITRLFQDRGWSLVVVGGSALEVYTEGQYLSGDIDVCRQQGQKPIPPPVRDLVAEIITPSPLLPPEDKEGAER